MNKQKINQEIFANRLMLIDENGKSLGKVSWDQAMLLAYDRELDLVEVGPNANPPVAKLLDFGKELYHQQKQIQKQKAKHKGPQLKEIKLSVRIDEHDFNTKLNRAKDFFKDGDKVRVYIKLMGRENIFQDKAREVIERFKTELNADFEESIKRLGNQFSAILKKVS
ncbi:translation initiation factor IF-3 [Candidatus Berkelbacteria bacterium RIFCSPHIGHO2_12_FULL_36_9]|uniref:Translation initiation factor IF-3 n=1 Tax=Candidatus Berkelbacteria bacterium RIFCSPHIGHO2_12_FULL_36_9 TaxID=1797469 RepID=A0A1F5EE49_9BACT|nr:MAG: translation initiation factor IF-3 [Candidatus Berkelbacteria bacterium RIFCSPHIGHO2_12_FULL_36_9]